MGETRNPTLGQWSVFEGNTPQTHKTDILSRGGRGLNAPIEWPVTLRVFRIGGKVTESIDVEINEDLSVVVSTVDRYDSATELEHHEQPTITVKQPQEESA